VGAATTAMSLNNTTIAFAGTGIQEVSGASIFTFGDNRVFFSLTPGAPNQTTPRSNNVAYHDDPRFASAERGLSFAAARTMERR